MYENKIHDKVMNLIEKQKAQIKDKESLVLKYAALFYNNHLTNRFL